MKPYQDFEIKRRYEKMDHVRRQNKIGIQRQNISFHLKMGKNCISFHINQRLEFNAHSFDWNDEREIEKERERERSFETK